MKPQAPSWILVDAEGKTLGRVAAHVVLLLRGKNKPTFSPHAVFGDHVIIVNIAKLSIPPRKQLRKVYRHHTGHPGHLREVSFGVLFRKDPVRVMRLAVAGMLPKNTLKTALLKRLHIFSGSEHPYGAQKPQSVVLP